MDTTTRDTLHKLVRALRALAEGIQRNMEYGLQSGSGATAYKSYSALHARIAEILADDVYVTEALRLDLPESADDATRLGAVNLALRQLIAYLDTELRGVPPIPPVPPVPPIPPIPPVPPMPDFDGISRDIRDNVINVTRAALRRAVQVFDDAPNMSGANMVGVSLRGGDFTEGNLSGANCMKGDFTEAQFIDANLSGANFQGATLDHAVLMSANLSGANFQEAHLHAAQLDDANLSGANFQGADLQQAELRDANCKGVNFQGATLTAANLDDANLRGANFQGAALTQASFENAQFSRDTVMPDGSLWTPRTDMAQFTGE